MPMIPDTVAPPAGVARPLHQRRGMVIVMMALYTLGAVAVICIWVFADQRLEPLSRAINARDLGAQLMVWANQPLPTGSGLVLTPQAQQRMSDIAHHLRAALTWDSLALVPAYVGLIVSAYFLMFSRLGRHGSLWVHVLSVLPVAAGLYDLAENGMLGRAVRDFMTVSLADDTVRDVASAHDMKWLLMGASLAVLSGLSGAVATRQGQARPALGQLRFGHALLSALSMGAAVCLATGLWVGMAAVLSIGVVLMGLSLTALPTLAWLGWREGGVVSPID